MTNTTDKLGAIRAALDGNRIMVYGDALSTPRVAKLPGLLPVTGKLPPGTRHMRLNVESIVTLRNAGARANRELLEAAKRLIATQRYIEAQKQGKDTGPLRPIPLKPDITPFAHQVRAYNIVLALFGYPTNGGDVNEHV